MKVLNLHPWKVTTLRARQIQEKLRDRILEIPLKKTISIIAAADVSYDKKTDKCFACVVVLSFPQLKIMEVVKKQIPSPFPYVPGLLSFREAPALVRAFRALRTRPQLVLFDGQGRAHPRFFGLASHMGLLLDLPAIGCAKTRLIGEYMESALGKERGSWVPLTHRGQRVGAVLRTKTGVKPVFISVGHKINLASARKMILSCCSSYRLPDPLRWAHQETVKFRKNH